MFRTRFRQEIVAKFLPPSRLRKAQKLIILCDGMPSIPRKQPLAEFLAAKGFWVIYPRYREHGKAVVSFLRNRPIKTFSTSSTTCQRSLRKLRSVVASSYRRIKSSSSEEALVVRQRSCYRLIHE